MDYSEAMRLMGKIGGVNILVGEDVAGSITAQLKDVPWEVAFKTLLDMKTLGADIDAKKVELKAEWDAQAYARTRKPLYPDIGDQLDDLYKEGAFSASMTAKLKKVKDDNPKG